MDIIKLFKILFGKNKKEEVKSKTSEVVDEKVLAYRELEDNMHEELRIKELEDNILKSFEAFNYSLTYMENKVGNIAGHLTSAQKLSYLQTAEKFENGICICDCAMPNPFKFPKVIKYYYENFYSDEKQLEYYNYNQSVIAKYKQLEKELVEKYK